jgi:hypothetical protein
VRKLLDSLKVKWVELKKRTRQPNGVVLKTLKDRVYSFWVGQLVTWRVGRVGFTSQQSRIQVSLVSLESLKAYIIVNFRAYENSQNTRKLTQTPTLIIIKKTWYLWRRIGAFMRHQ